MEIIQRGNNLNGTQTVKKCKAVDLDHRLMSPFSIKKFKITIVF